MHFSGRESFEDYVGVRITRLAEAFARLAKLTIEQPWSLRNTDLRILNVLDSGESVPISEIARRTRVDKAWISRSVRELEARELIRKFVDTTDSRVSLAIITPKGRELLDEIRPHAKAADARVLEGIGSASFKRDLDRLLQNAETILQREEVKPMLKRFAEVDLATDGSRPEGPRV